MSGFIINVDHWPNYKFVTVSGYGKHNLPDKFFRQYTVGKMKPNYPMPAIRTDIEILPNRVVLWTRYNGRLDYRYLA